MKYFLLFCLLLPTIMFGFSGNLTITSGSLENMGNISTTPIYHNEDEYLLSGVYITEINAHDTNMLGEYIIITTPTTYSGTIIIKGLGQGQKDKEVVLLSGSNHPTIITDSPIPNIAPDKYNIITLGSISLTNTGEPLTILDNKHNPLDSIVYTESTNGEVLVYNTHNGTERIFSKKTSSSIETSQPITTGINSTSGVNSIESNETLPYITEIHPQETTSTPEYIELFFPQAFSGTLIFHGGGHGKGKISITLEAHTKQYILFTKKPTLFDSSLTLKHIPNLSLTDSGEEIIVSRQNGQHIDRVVYQQPKATQSLYYSNKSGDERLFYTHKQPTPGVSESILSYVEPIDTSLPKGSQYYEDLYRKRKQKYTNLVDEIRFLGHTVSSSGSLVISSNNSKPTSLGYTFGSGDFFIQALLPNPKGADQDREQIYISSSSSLVVSTSGHSLYNGKKKVPLGNHLLNPGSTVALSGNRGLTNRPTCVSLETKGIYSNPFCYPKAKDDQRFTSSLPFVSGASISETNTLLSSLSLQLQDNQACMLLGKKNLSCTPLPYTTEEAKTWKKEAKKVSSLERLLEKEKLKNSKEKEKYSELRTKLSLYKQETKAKNSLQQSYLQQQKNISRLYNNFTWSMLDILEEERGPLYYSTNIPEYHTFFQYLLEEVEENKQTHTYHGIQIDFSDIGNLHSLYTHRQVPLDQVEILPLYQTLFKQTTGTIDTFLKNLKHQPGL